MSDGSPFGPPAAEQRPQGVGTPSSPGAAAGPPGESRPAAPTSKFRQLIDRAKGATSTAKPASSPAPASSREKRPSAGKGKRVSAAGTIADVYGGIGTLAIRTGRHAPLGRCMQWQAPVAGEMLDDAIAGTFIDKVALQRIEKARGRYDLLGAVFGPPLLVLAIEQNPANAEILMPMLAASIRHSLPLMVPAIKKAKAREKAVAEATAELFADDPDYPADTDPVDYVLRMMFAGWIPENVPTEPAPGDEVADPAAGVAVP